MTKEINSFRKGLKDGMPIFFGYLSVSFAFGIFAVGEGLSILEAVLISLTNLTSAGQLAAVPILVGGGSFAELILSQLVINLRYSLMSVSLSQKLGDSVKMRHRFPIAFGVTDEIFAVSVSQEENVGKNYLFGLILLPVVGWTLGTLFGAVAGSVLPEVLASALGIAIYGMFIAIVVPPAKKHLPTALAVLASIGIGILLRMTPISDGFVTILSAVSVSLLFAFLCPIEEKGEERS